MSEFLEEVFAAQSEADEPPPRRGRPVGEGLSGSAWRFTMLLALLVSLTAVPTWIMLRAGADELNQPMAVPVRPVLPLHPPQTTEAPVSPPSRVPPPVRADPEPVRKAEPPQPPKRARPKVLERQSVVDTPSRPIHKRTPHQGVPTQPAPCTPDEQPSSRCGRPSGSPTHCAGVEETTGHCRRPNGAQPEPPIFGDPDVGQPDIDPPGWLDEPEFDRPRWSVPPCFYGRDSDRRAFSYPASTRRTGSTT